MNTIVNNMAQPQQNPLTSSEMSANNSKGVIISDEYVQFWINQLEQWTTIFYSQPNAQNMALWQEYQNKLVQFQKLNDPIDLCSQIIKKSRNSLVLYQAVLCLKNSLGNEFKKYDVDELFTLFQFLYEFLCSQALENDMPVNETTALICAIIIKRIASETSKSLSPVTNLLIAECGLVGGNQEPPAKITHVITTLCNNIKDRNESLSKKVASALMLSYLLLESQLSNRSSQLGIRVWKHINGRRVIGLHLKQITETALETINWVFSSNLLNPLNQNRETQILFHLITSLIHCVEYSLSFNSPDNSWTTTGDRYTRVIHTRTIASCFGDLIEKPKNSGSESFYDLIMSDTCVQFLFDLYTTVKQMNKCAPGWTWPETTLKNCLNCLYYLSDSNTHYTHLNSDNQYIDFVGNLMLGVSKIMDTEVDNIDDSYQIAYLITSISLHTSEVRDTISKVRREHLIPFLDSAQRYTIKIFTKIASMKTVDEEEEESKTIDALLDFWYHILRNIDTDLRLTVGTVTPTSTGLLKITSEVMKSYSRTIVEHYISCHLHKPLGQLEPKIDENIQEVDLDQADEQDDNSLHSQQLVSFSMISRFDALHTAKVLIQLLSARISHLEALLTQYINTRDTPEGIKDWEYINDDLHWLMLMLQHYLTQTGYGEIGFMCSEILNASLLYEANVQKTLEAFEKCDYNNPEVDPIIRLIIIALKFCQIEINICRSGKIGWLSVQTNGTLTSLLSRFCLTYLYPKESDYTVISENMNYCFGQDAPTAENFLKYVIEHTCCIVMYMKADPQVVKKNVQLLIQLLTFHPNVKSIFADADPNSMIKTFTSQMRPDHLAGFSPRVAKSIIRLATRLFVEDDDWDKLISFFNCKWEYIMSSINQQHQNGLVATKFLEFCDFAIGVCEACDDETSERLFEQLLLPIVKAMPTVLQALGSFESVSISVFELLYYIVKLPMVNIAWENQAAKSFHDHCKILIQTYSKVAVARKDRGNDEEDCEDIISLLTFSHEVMKRDWGNNTNLHEVIICTMEELTCIMKSEYLEFPKIRSMYYRLLVYLVDEEERLANLSDKLLETIVSSIIHALQSKFDRDIDNHVYTIIGIISKTIYLEKDEPISPRLSSFMMPVLPVLFHTTMNQGAFTINAETAELVAPALFALRCCFLDVYKMLVKELIEKQDDNYARSKVESLFADFESKIEKLTLNRAAIREVSPLFVPFLAEVHNYITTK